MPTFNDSENKLMFQPPGDYIFTVIGLEKKLVSSGKCAGSSMDALKLEIRHPKTGATSTLFDNLIDHEKTAWKYDVFLKSAGIKIAKGQAFELHPDPRIVGGINPFGLRGWCAIRESEFNGKKKNEVVCYYTDREKLPPVKIEVEGDGQAADDAAFGKPVESDDVPFN